MSNDREFVGQVLRKIKVHFPDLYSQHIKGRHAQFTYENTSPEFPNGWRGEKLGYLNKDLRLLLALAFFFRRQAEKSHLQMQGFSSEEDMYDASKLRLVMQAVAFEEMASLCLDEFWSFVRDHFGQVDKTRAYLVRSEDWSVHVVNRKATAPRIPTRLERVLYRIEGQAVAEMVSQYMYQLASH